MTVVKVTGGYRCLSEKTQRNMGTYKTKAEATNRMNQIESFKKKYIKK